MAYQQLVIMQGFHLSWLFYNPRSVPSLKLTSSINIFERDFKALKQM